MRNEIERVVIDFENSFIQLENDPFTRIKIRLDEEAQLLNLIWKIIKRNVNNYDTSKDRGRD